MVTLYKDGAECNCDLDQVAIMEKAGWSKTKDKPKAAPVAKKKFTPKKASED